MVAWRRASGRRRHSVQATKESPPSGTAATPAATAAAAAEAAAAALRAAEAGEVAPDYQAAVAAPSDPSTAVLPYPEHVSGGKRSSNSGEERQTSNTESLDGLPQQQQQQQQQPVDVAVVEEGIGGRHHIIRTTAKQQQFRRSNSGVSLMSLKSVGSLNDVHRLTIP